VELIIQRSNNNLHVVGLCALVIGSCLLSDTASGLYSLILQKVGVDKYSDCLTQIIKSEDFVNAEQGKSHMPSEDMNKLMFYDYDYTLFFQRALQRVMSKIKPEPIERKSLTQNSTNQQQNIEASQQIKDRDFLIAELQAKIGQLEKELVNGALHTELAKYKEENEDLKEEKKKNSKQNKSILKQKLTLANQKNLTLEQRVVQLEEQLKQNDVTNNTNLNILHSRTEDLEKQLKEKDQKFAHIEAEQEELYMVLAEKSAEIKRLKQQLGLPDDEESDGEGDEDGDNGDGGGGD